MVSISQSSFLIFGSRLLAMMLIVVSGVLIARAFGPEGRGLFDLFIAATGLMATLGGLGLGNATVYLIRRKERNPARLFSNVVLFGVSWGLFLAALFLFLAYIFPEIFSSFPGRVLPLIAAAIPFLLLVHYLMPFFLVRLQFAKWGMFSVLYGIFLVIGVLVSTAFFDDEILSVLWTVFLATLLTFALVFFAAFRDLEKPSLAGLRFDLTLFSEQLFWGVRSYLVDAFSWVSSRINIFMISLFLPVSSVGYYAVALDATAILGLVAVSFQQAFYPLWSARREEEADRNTPQAARQAFLVGAAGGVLLFAFGWYAIPLLYGEEFSASLLPFLLLLPGMVCMVFAGVFFANFFSRGKPHVANGILAAVLVINVFLGLILIPDMGIGGAALALSASWVAAGVLAVLAFWRLTRQNIGAIVVPRTSDIRILWERMRALFRTKKLMRVDSDLSVSKLKKFYDEKAATDGASIMHATFDAGSPFKKLFYATRVDILMRELAIGSGDRVLDIGCGIGYYTQQLAKRTHRVVATDISAGYLERAKENNPYPIEAYVPCVVEELPFENNSFDKVLLSEVIEHLIDPTKGLQEIFRVLKPGGKVVVTTPNKRSYLNILYHIRVTIADSRLEQDHIKEFSREELEQLLGEYFSVERIGYVNYFPAILPARLVELVGFERIKQGILFIEGLLHYIPLVRRAGFVLVARARKHGTR